MDLSQQFLSTLIGGVVGDKVGPKQVLISKQLLGRLLGAARGLTNDYLSLMRCHYLFSVLIPLFAINNIRAIGQWFPPHQLGLSQWTDLP
ncbi:MAG: hypothetical protein IPO22_02430 [Anaerolineales bacterium]|nr:hypothetical protein [Anaerolineales bacterium]